MFDEHLLFSDQILHCLNPAIITFVLFAWPSHHQNNCPLHHTLHQINRLQHIQNAIARTVVHAPQFQHITPNLKSLHWLKVSKRIEYEIRSLSLTKLSIPLSHRNSMTSYLFRSLIDTAYALRLMSFWLTHLYHWKSLIAHDSPHLWN